MMKLPLLFTPALALAALAVNAPALEMTLTDAQGREIKADVLEIRGNMLRFTRDGGKPVELPINQLDPATQQELAQKKDLLMARDPLRLRIEAAAEKVAGDDFERDAPPPPSKLGDRRPPGFEKGWEVEWAYDVTFHNTSGQPIPASAVEYRLFGGETAEEVRVMAERAELPALEGFSEWSTQTRAMRIGPDEKLFGMALRVTVPESGAVLFEWKSPTLTRVTVDWETQPEPEMERRGPPRPLFKTLKANL